ncbi:hypothetical protein GWK47_024414 [Chionoecetes opilio]|uniref:Uncharacterized protein n=1 Tax=Chionoecetes opilio TaxID=41210 RepID=A0A8J4XLD0_CHIOP|nr:hypothetical protein GWK47_024414 [Chionoecetes opilio]
MCVTSSADGSCDQLPAKASPPRGAPVHIVTLLSLCRSGISDPREGVGVSQRRSERSYRLSAPLRSAAAERSPAGSADATECTMGHGRRGSIPQPTPTEPHSKVRGDTGEA